ncbi:helix-turn-helix transcriptional regulator [Desulfobacter curvatus]|uniref:helix-turn-helix transcriptional regulator n=1 Tax=Desulfobacter curvatus TaxID=2290 RepID=UPI000376347B|nr:helix-turn-helix domain-containing protein [Desulfobacter curvatus]
MAVKLITVHELSTQLNRSPQSIYNGISRNAKNKFPIRAIRVGRAVRFSQKEVDEFIQKGGCS